MMHLDFSSVFLIKGKAHRGSKNLNIYKYLNIIKEEVAHLIKLKNNILKE